MLGFNLQSFLQAKEKERGRDPEWAWCRGAGHMADDSLLNQAAAGQASAHLGWYALMPFSSPTRHDVTAGQSLPLLDPMEFTGSSQSKRPVSKATTTLCPRASCSGDPEELGAGVPLARNDTGASHTLRPQALGVLQSRYHRRDLR